MTTAAPGSSARPAVFVAFLRAVNVGDHGKLKMAALREALRSEGFTTATSYIQSGNLVLAHPAHGTPDATRRALEDLLDRRFGLKTSAVVLAADALAGALRGGLRRLDSGCGARAARGV